MILTERGIFNNSFEARDIARAGKVLLENTEAYRILNGEKFKVHENACPSEEMKEWYDNFIDELSGEVSI